MQDYLDNGVSHEDKIKYKELACSPLSGFNHIAVFLRWSYSNNMLADQLFEKEPRLKAALDGKGDVREILATSDALKGMLRPSYFKKEYMQFILETYSFKNLYCKKVDEYALKCFGEEKYNSAEYKNEAYLFVPYDDAYYDFLSAFLNGEWEIFSKEYTGDPDFITSGKNKSLTLEQYLGEKEDVIIPDGFVVIGIFAFKGCEGVKKVTIPSSVKTISNRAFFGLESLEEVIIPEGLETIEHEAFRGCINLKKADLPNSLKKMDYAVFYDCKSLVKFEIGNKLKVFEANITYHCNSLQELVIPKTIQKVTDYSFAGMEGLKSLRIESDLSKNKRVCFIDCANLTDITFTEGYSNLKGIHVVDCPKAEHVTVGDKTYPIVVKKKVGTLVLPDSPEKKTAPEKDAAIDFRYSEEDGAYICEYKGIVFTSDHEPEEEDRNTVRTLAENYHSNLNRIAKYIISEIKEIFGKVTVKTLLSKLGKPTIDYEAGLVSYFEQDFDRDHIFEFEFMDDEFEELENFTIGG